MPSRPPIHVRDRDAGKRCPKRGLLGDQCTETRYHGGKHTYPLNPKKTPGIKPSTEP